jgi:hypothetical protein
MSFNSFFGGGPGNAARVRREQEIRDRQLLEERTQDPYGQNAPQWDSSGFPVGGMPRGRFALDYQYEANRRAEERRRMLWGDAQQSMRQGLDLLQSYRPGGVAALASGGYSQKAQMYGTEALNTSAPDLLIDWREQIRQRAEQKTNELNRNSQLITGLSSFNVLAGGTPTALQDQPEMPGADENVSGAPGGTAPGGMQGDPGSSMFGGGGGAAPAGGGVAGGGEGAPGTYQAGLGGGPGMPGGGGRWMDRAGGRPSVEGGYGGGGGGGGAGPGGGGGGGGQKAQQPGGGAGGGMAGGGAGPTVGSPGAPTMGDFSGNSVASQAMADAPGSVQTSTSLWADDPTREQSTALIMQGARSRLIDALPLMAGRASALASKPQYSGEAWQEERFGRMNEEDY